MSFEIKEKDMLARLGKLETKTGKVETPLLFPVINPRVQLVPPKKLKETFGFEAIITNAYILRKSGYDKPVTHGLHDFLDYDGVAMTDSGAYQILVYGDVEVSPKEIVSYQEQIGSDIATILDIPTGWEVRKDQAEKTVTETLRRAEDFFTFKQRDDILWVGPVQGGRHLDLVASSARRMGSLPFQIHALGSPTEVMENYRFDVLVDMIMTAKMNLPPERPLHLFGAGHPFMMSLAVSLGCDLFDSAAYALYARQDRYMTENGTWRVNEMDFFPCSCPKCVTSTPKIVGQMQKPDREVFLAEHNLYVCKAEINRIKQAIRDGRLWEHVEMRCHTHPTLLSALKRVKKYQEYIERFSPASKKSGLFFFSGIGLSRPEVIHYRNKLMTRVSPPKEAKVLLLVPQTREKPFHKAPELKKIRRVVNALPATTSRKVHICVYSAPFGIIPLELDEVYPLSQHESALPLDDETIQYVASQTGNYIASSHCRHIVLFNDPDTWGDAVLKKCRGASKKTKARFSIVTFKSKEDKRVLTRLEKVLAESLGDQS